MGKGGKAQTPRLGSRKWSCSELEEGHGKLMGAKEEVDDEAEQKIKEPNAFDLDYVVLTMRWC